MEDIQSLAQSRCGLLCRECSWKEPCNCGGCIETRGNPFHGECHIAVCCQDKGLVHCGECEELPCDNLYAYSYLDEEHGDKPPGLRIQAVRKWAAVEGKNIFNKVLLTSAGFKNPAIRDKFLSLLDKPADETKVLFVPTAAIDEEAQYFVPLCREELISTGINPNNIFTYDIDGTLMESEAMTFDIIYFTGGSTQHLLKKIRQYHFDKIIKRMVYANKVYVGVSAGSLIATVNVGLEGLRMNKEDAGLALIQAFISVHCQEGDETTHIELQKNLPLPYIGLTDDQAILVRNDGYEVIQ